MGILARREFVGQECPTYVKKRRLVLGRVVVLILIQVSVELLSLRGWAEVRIGGQNFKQI
jgi:hypothetical protein